MIVRFLAGLPAAALAVVCHAASVDANTATQAELESVACHRALDRRTRSSTSGAAARSRTGKT